jgi:hypothetical protein
MHNAGRATILPEDAQQRPPMSRRSHRRTSLLLTATPRSRCAVRRLTACPTSSGLQARVAQLQALVFRGFARWGSRMAERRTALAKPAGDALLTKLGEARRSLLEVQRQLRRGCVQAKGMDGLVGDIDDLARFMTGDCTCFHARAPAGNTAFRDGEN